MANFTRVLRRQPTWRFYNVVVKESGLPTVFSCRYRQTPEYTRINGKSRLVNLVLLPLWYGNKDIIRDNISKCHR